LLLDIKTGVVVAFTALETEDGFGLPLDANLFQTMKYFTTFGHSSKLRAQMLYKARNPEASPTWVRIDTWLRYAPGWLYSDCNINIESVFKRFQYRS
jgi:hypothetical protein